MPTETTYIAVVDDHVLVRKGLCTLVNMFSGYKVLFEANNGKDMIQNIDQGQIPHMVLLDISMPQMDGYETAIWLTENHPQIRILALSTLDTEPAILRMIRSGAKGYILKDADPAELKHAFDNMLTTGYYYNETIIHKVMNSVILTGPENNNITITNELTPREQEFLEYACLEKTYPEIAREMGVSLRTIDGYREAIFKKFGVTSRIGLVLHAIRNKMIAL